jgi:hypothetical protein
MLEFVWPTIKSTWWRFVQQFNKFILSETVDLIQYISSKRLKYVTHPSIIENR